MTRARDGLLGRMCISREVVPGWSPFGTMCLNDEGLAITHANTPPEPDDSPHHPDKPQIGHNFIEKIVAETDREASYRVG